MDKIGKQAVMNKVHNLEVIELGIKVKKKKDVRIIYVEADEDHVALHKKGKKKEENQRDYKVAMPRLVCLHEGVDFKKNTKKRRVLKNVRYFGGVYKNTEDLWLEVTEYIYKQ